MLTYCEVELEISHHEGQDELYLLSAISSQSLVSHEQLKISTPVQLILPLFSTLRAARHFFECPNFPGSYNAMCCIFKIVVQDIFVRDAEKWRNSAIQS